LWVSWFGFNDGSTFALTDQIPVIIALTGAAGMLSTEILGWQKRRQVEAETLINGSIAGLVSITAGCNSVATPIAVMIGERGVIMLLATEWIEHRGIDDEVDAVAIYGFAGAWGTWAVGLKEIVEIILLLCRPLVGNKELELVNAIASSTPPIRADEDRLQQILLGTFQRSSFQLNVLIRSLSLAIQ